MMATGQMTPFDKVYRLTKRRIFCVRFARTIKMLHQNSSSEETVSVMIFVLYLCTWYYVDKDVLMGGGVWW